MNTTRIFASADAFQPSDGEPLRTVVTESSAAVIVAWYLKPGQSIAAHVHPHGQDSWTILSGQGDYRLDALGTCQPIGAGDVVVAPIGAVHGVVNSGDEPLMFISVVSPGNAGYELLGS
jgi:quercetin dioxygenase-like cupin family protein